MECFHIAWPPGNADPHGPPSGVTSTRLLHAVGGFPGRRTKQPDDPRGADDALVVQAGSGSVGFQRGLPTGKLAFPKEIRPGAYLSWTGYVSGWPIHPRKEPSQMGIGTGLAFIAMGAILAFASNSTSAGSTSR